MSALGVRLIAAVSVAASFGMTALLLPWLLEPADNTVWQAGLVGSGVILALAIFSWSQWALPVRADRAAIRMFPFRLSAGLMGSALVAATVSGMYLGPRSDVSGLLVGALSLLLLVLPIPTVFLVTRRALRPVLIQDARSVGPISGRRQRFAWGLLIVIQLPIIVCGLAMVLIEQHTGTAYERDIAHWHHERYQRLLIRASEMLGPERTAAMQSVLLPPPAVEVQRTADGRLTMSAPLPDRALALKAPFALLALMIGLTWAMGRWLSSRIADELETARRAIDAIQGGVPAQTAVEGLDRAVAVREMSGLVGAVQLALSGFEHRRIALRSAAQRRRGAEQAKARFLRHLSHELKSPLNSILGFSELLLAEIDGPITPRQRDQLGAIWSAGEELERYILTLLDLARLEEAGRAATLLAPGRHAASALARAIEAQLRPDPLGHCTIEVITTGDAPCQIDLEPTARAIRLAVGLLSDCVHHGELRLYVGPAPGGGVRVDMDVHRSRSPNAERLGHLRSLANLGDAATDAGAAEACVHLLRGMMAAQGGRFALELDDRDWPRCWLTLPAA